MILIQHATLGGFNRVHTGGHRNAFKINGKKGVWARSGMCDVQLHAALRLGYNVHQRAYVQEVAFHKHVPYIICAWTSGSGTAQHAGRQYIHVVLQMVW